MGQLNRKLTLYGLTMIAIGSCIGSGIFITPAKTIENLPHYGYALIPWVLGGIATFLGALTFSELGARFPKSGGVYVYIKESFGPLAGFLYGWIILLIVNTGALAALGLAFSDYLNFFISVDEMDKKIIAVVTIIGLSLINIRGVGVSQSLSNVFTGLKLFALFLIILLGAYFIAGDSSNIVSGMQVEKPDNLASGILIAFVGVFWSFGGWHHATYLSGEAIDPQRTVPRAMLYGTGTVMLVYLLVIIAYMGMTPLQEMMVSERIAGDAVANAITGGGKLVALVITISIFGTIAIYTMTAPRIYFAMAQDGVFFQSLSRVHPTFKTPNFAILLQAGWACCLVLIWGSFTKLLTFVTFMDLVFMALAASSIFYFRRKYNDKPAFYLKAYPFVPIIYLVILLSFVIYTLGSLQLEAVVGTLILIAGVPVYFIFRAINKVNQQ